MDMTTNMEEWALYWNRDSRYRTKSCLFLAGSFQSNPIHGYHLIQKTTQNAQGLD